MTEIEEFVKTTREYLDENLENAKHDAELVKTEQELAVWHRKYLGKDSLIAKLFNLLKQ